MYEVYNGGLPHGVVYLPLISSHLSMFTSIHKHKNEHTYKSRIHKHERIEFCAFTKAHKNLIHCSFLFFKRLTISLFFTTHKSERIHFIYFFLVQEAHNFFNSFIQSVQHTQNNF